MATVTDVRRWQVGDIVIEATNGEANIAIGLAQQGTFIPHLFIPADLFTIDQMKESFALAGRFALGFREVTDEQKAS